MDLRDGQTQQILDPNQPTHVYHLALDIGGRIHLLSCNFFNILFLSCFSFHSCPFGGFHSNLTSLLCRIYWDIRL